MPRSRPRKRYYWAPVRPTVKQAVAPLPANSHPSASAAKSDSVRARLQRKVAAKSAQQPEHVETQIVLSSEVLARQFETWKKEMTPVEVVEFVRSTIGIENPSGMNLLMKYFAYITPHLLDERRLWLEHRQQKPIHPDSTETMEKTDAKVKLLLDEATTSLYDAVKQCVGVPKLLKIIMVHVKSTENGLRDLALLMMQHGIDKKDFGPSNSMRW
uniref:Uncharacterized protein n=1 Tax=Peronospora matthiolae TaxID=2874970 RepID=A0AAV1TUA2_9STRA